MLQICLLAAGTTQPTTMPALPSLPTPLPAPWSDITGNALLQTLLLLLPGLVTVAIITSLTVKQKLEPLERVIQALLYTFVNHVTWQVALLLMNLLFLIFTWGHYTWYPTAKGQLIGLGVCAVVWGVFVTWLINLGWLHDKLRDLSWIKRGLERMRLTKFAKSLPEAMWFGITKRSSRPSEWYDAFYESDNQFVVVHLKDERRVFGWARLYPDLPTEGHLMICDAEWLDRPADSPKPPLVRILIDVTDVRFVEFVTSQPEDKKDAGTTPEALPTGTAGNGEEGRREPEADRQPATPATAPTVSQEVID